MELVIGYLVSIIPAALMLLWLRKAVRNVEGYDRRCGKAFVRGMLSVLMVTLLGFILSVILGLTVDKKEQYLLYAALHNFVVVAMSEEISKYLACRHVLKKDAPDASLLETVVYAIIAAMGFGFLESIVYAFTTNVMQMIVRGVTMMHGTFAFTVGRFMVKDRKSGQKAYTWLGLAISTFLHGLYDFCLDEKLNEMNEWTGAVSLLLAVVSLVQVFLILRYVRRKRDLEEYVAPFHCG